MLGYATTTQATPFYETAYYRLKLVIVFPAIGSTTSPGRCFWGLLS